MNLLQKFNRFISSLNFVLSIAGYQLATTLLLPVSSDIERNSQIVTIPYRALALIISLIVILMNLDKKIVLNKKTVLLLFFWLLYIIRIIYDLSFRTEDYFTSANKIGFYTGVFLITLIPMISALLSYKIINYNFVLKLSILFIAVGMFISIISSSVIDLSQVNMRLGGNMALNAISYGMTGSIVILLCMSYLRKYDVNMLYKIFLFIVLIVGIYTIGRAASRSPLLGLLLVLVFYISARQRNLMKGLIVGIILLLLVILFKSFILDIIGDISPTLELRMRAAIEQGDYSDRNLLYNKAFNQFLKNPIIGDYFVLYPENGRGINSHNSILDAFMALGMFGGIIFIIILITSFRTAYIMLKHRNNLDWLGLLLLLQILLGMSSGSFYNDQLLSFLLALCFSHNIPREYPIKKDFSHYRTNNFNQIIKATKTY